MVNISNPSKNYIAEAKHECMLDNNVKILTFKEIAKISGEVLAAIGGKKEFDKMRV